jgi:branched-chain amino acid transport system substrate-binding protein
MKPMKWHLLFAAGAALLPLASEPVLAQNEQFIPGLMYRTGPFAPNGIPFANGFADYLTLLNQRDGGINGVKIVYEECDTAYNNDRGVECYERLKKKGPTGASAITPLSTGITYALIERATADKIPVLSMGYGRTAGSDGTVFPYVFTMPASYWAGADVLVTYVARQSGGFDKLKGKKIALVYLDSAYGKEPIPTLQALAQKHGYEFHSFPVASPGLEQKATWLQIGRQLRPDYVFMWGWGVMNSTAIKEAAAVGFPMDRFIGVWWSGAEPDVVQGGAASKGYKALNFHTVAKNLPVHKDITQHVYRKGLGAGEEKAVGEVLYNRGIVNALIITESIRVAQGRYGKRPVTGEEVRWGMENINLTEARLKELGLPDFMAPIKVTCADHEGGGMARVQQWDGKEWKFVSDWIAPNRDQLWPMYRQAAADYAKEKNVTPRNCS